MTDMAVSVTIPGLLVNCTRGNKVISVTGETLKECFDNLLQSYPLLKIHLYDENGAQRQHVNFFYNDQNTRWLDNWDIYLENGDKVTIIQAVSGG